MPAVVVPAAGVGERIGEWWDTVTSPQPAPSALVVWGTAAAALVCLVVPWLWHVTRHALTIVHEASHAGVARLVGRQVSGIRVHSDTSGLTLSRGRARGPGMVATAAAGYPGPALVGLGAAWLTSEGYAVGVLWALLVVLMLVLLMIRNWYVLWSVLVSGVVLVAVTVWGQPELQVAFAYGLVWFLLLGAPRAVIEMQQQRRRTRGPDTSDAGMLGRLTHLPGAVWVLILLLVCAAALVVGGAWLIGFALI